MDEKSYTERLPDNYHQRLKIDVKNDKKLAIWLNISAFLMLLPFAALYYIFFYGKNGVPGVGDAWWLWLIIIGSSVAAIILHELIHALFFKLYAHGSRIKFGFTGIFAYAANPDGYYFKEPYYMIGIMPAVLITLGLVITLFCVSGAAFFIVYTVMALHFAGCLGDIYVCHVLSRQPAHTYVFDDGLSMTMYVRRLTKKGK